MDDDAFAPMPLTPRSDVEVWMRQYQDWLCHRLETADGGGARFAPHEQPPEAGQCTCARVLEQGAVLEKGSVVLSASQNPGNWPPSQPGAPPCSCYATGLSAVQHPHSPWVPISHLSLYYCEASNGEAWFGGGLDLTPIYVDAEQARWFHTQLANVCRRHDGSYYRRFKQRADAYYYLPHRGETRGVGGLYFDRLAVGTDGLFEELFAFVQDVGEAYGHAYAQLMRQNATRPYTPREQQWQQVRRGRCAEFNLIVEQAGLPRHAQGRPTPLELALPPRAAWPHAAPEPDSPEAHTQQWLRQGIDWLSAA